MKTTKLFLVLLCTAFSFGIKGQVTVENENSVTLGATNNAVYSGTTGKYGQFTNVILGYPNNKGTVIEGGNAESGGIYMDGDKVVIWSPGDDNLVNFCDEDLIEDPASDFHQAIIAYIDGDGYYYQISDSTSKEQIRIINSPLLKVMQLRGVEYYHKSKMAKLNNKTSDNAQADNKKTDKEKKTGFLAQEVEVVMPEAVATSKTGIKYVNYQALIPVMVEAMKEQQKQLSSQEQKIKDLQEQLNLIQISLRKK